MYHNQNKLTPYCQRRIWVSSELPFPTNQQIRFVSCCPPHHPQKPPQKNKQTRMCVTSQLLPKPTHLVSYPACCLLPSPIAKSEYIPPRVPPHSQLNSSAKEDSTSSSEPSPSQAGPHSTTPSSVSFIQNPDIDSSNPIQIPVSTYSSSRSLRENITSRNSSTLLAPHDASPRSAPSTSHMTGLEEYTPINSTQGSQKNSTTPHSV